ncbi:hypothetical protein [Oleiagrimonas sp. MCCC 1A03011]|uniref:hypothetical protein n=1 Tax=Oleiagrimonas sp. MCCC 1A03011 TaxID=1926883 RepID=UPI000DC2E710|nr:hypothetical protein [Oleiagrimonas sp. MCCC 1A03011]RAP59541.1 hypothetical protein BTJ49_02495 [Oleiagrimonas sp. MCCC 1A03011]
MKTVFSCFVLVAATISAPVLSKSPHGSPLLGRWAVVKSRLPMPPAQRPKKVVIAFRPADLAKLTMDVDIVYANGKAVHTVSTATLDGASYPVKGSPEADLYAMKMPQPDTLVLALSMHGIPASTRIYTVAADHKHMTETAVYYDKNGHPILKTHYFTRMGPKHSDRM